MAEFSYPIGKTKSIVLHSAIIATATSVAQLCAGAKKVFLVLTEGGTVLNRSGALTVEVSGDGTNFYALNTIVDNVTNTNAQTLTRIASKTRAAAGTDLLSLEPAGFTHFRTVVTITDGATPTGNFTVTGAIEF